jgi:hypothetical protein
LMLGLRHHDVNARKRDGVRVGRDKKIWPTSRAYVIAKSLDGLRCNAAAIFGKTGRARYSDVASESASSGRCDPP